jgi:hypothetical protein
MKQLTKEQQEQAVELIEKSITENVSYKDYIESAKAFLQSLKPKVYVCSVTSGEISFYKTNPVNGNDYFTSDIHSANTYNIEDAQDVKNRLLQSYNNIFILTE